MSGRIAHLFIVFPKVRLLYSYGFDFHHHAHRKCLDGEGGAGGRVGAVILGINLVHGFEVGHVAEQAGRFHHVSEGVAGLFEDGADVLHHLFGLFFNGVGDLAGGGIYRNLTGDVEGSVDFNGLAVGTDGLGSFVGVDDFFHNVDSLNCLFVDLFFLSVEFVADGGEEEDVDVADEEQQVGFLVPHLRDFA